MKEKKMCDESLSSEFSKLQLSRPRTRFLTRLRPRADKRRVAVTPTQRPRAVAVKSVRLEREISSTRRLFGAGHAPPAAAAPAGAPVAQTASPAVRRARSGAASPDSRSRRAANSGSAANAAAGADDTSNFEMAQRYLEQRLRPRTRSTSTIRERAASL
jgi:hypothetical protein